MSAVSNIQVGNSDATVPNGHVPVAMKTRLVGFLMAAMATLVLIQSSGCCSVPSGNGGMFMDKIFVCYRDKVWAARAYNEQFGGRPSLFTDHHRRGFIEGYCGVCRGGEGYVPAVPPKDYWGTQYQSEQGAICVNQWFEGYPEGAEMAKNDNAGRYSGVYISKMLDAAITQQKTGTKLPSDIRVIRNDVSEELEQHEQELNIGKNGSSDPLPLPNRDWSRVFPGDRAANKAENVPPPPIR